MFFMSLDVSSPLLRMIQGGNRHLNDVRPEN